MAKIPNISTKQFAYAVFGMLLGDGHLQKNKGGERRHLVIEHGYKQNAYAKYKARFLAEHSDNVTVKTKTVKMSFDPTYKVVVVRAKLKGNVLRHLNKFDRIYVDNDKKIASKYVMRRITAMGLMFWFMDDGTSSIVRNSAGALTRTFRLCTYGFDDSSKERISVCLRDRFGVDSRIIKVGNYTVHNLGVKGMKQLIEVVRPHLSMVPKSMRYKFSMDYADSKNSVYSPWGNIRFQAEPKCAASA